MFKTEIMTLARERAEALGVRNVLVTTNSGASVEAAQDALGPEYRFYAVGNPASAHDRGLVGHDGISEETQQRLEAKGIQVVLQDQSMFQRDNLYFTGVPLSQVIAETGSNERFGPLGMIFNVWQQMFGDGPRVCLEIAFMAADEGALPLDEDCMAIATPSSYCDLPDAALILRPTRSEDMFSGRLRIKDLILAPTGNDVWLSNGPLP